VDRLLWATLGVIDPALNAIARSWLIASQIAFGITAGWVVASATLVARADAPDRTRASARPGEARAEVPHDDTIHHPPSRQRWHSPMTRCRVARGRTLASCAERGHRVRHAVRPELRRATVGTDAQPRAR
jgi:hypothetical protein